MLHLKRIYKSCIRCTRMRMQWRVGSLLLLIWTCILLHFSDAEVDVRVDMVHRSDIDGASYAVGLTTIPPRFTTVHHTILSWVRQEHIRPAYVFVFVPSKYKRFKRKDPNSGISTETDTDTYSGSAQSLTRLLIQQIQHIQDMKGDEASLQCHIRITGPRAQNWLSQRLGNGAGDGCVVTVVVVSMQDDLGPALKYAGCLQLAQEWATDESGSLSSSNTSECSQGHEGCVDTVPSLLRRAIHSNSNSNGTMIPMPTHWVVCDDDVAYSPSTLVRYAIARSNFNVDAYTDAVTGDRDSGIGSGDGDGNGNVMLEEPTLLAHIQQRRKQLLEEERKHTVLTHFSEDYRLVLKLQDEPYKRPVMHVQGVDTVCFPTAILLKHQQAFQAFANTRGNLYSDGSDSSDSSSSSSSGSSSVTLPTLSPELFTAGLRYFHKLCPSTFYQDDYVVSYLLNIGDVGVRSLWNNDHVAKHIDGVSKANHQMHMNPRVHEREEHTKECIARRTNSAFKFLAESQQRKNRKVQRQEQKQEQGDKERNHIEVMDEF